MKDLKVKHNIPRRKYRHYAFLTLVLAPFFFTVSPLAGEARTKIIIWNCIKLKSFCTVRDYQQNKKATYLMKKKRYLQRIYQ